MTLLLTRSDIAPLLDLGEIIEAVERAHADLAAGLGAHPTPEGLEIPSGDALLVPMVSALRDFAAVKVMTDTPTNRSHGLPAQQSLIVVVDGNDGHCDAVLDGGLVTRMRTAATSAVATRHLARPDARTLGLIGAGGLARAHVDAIRRVRDLERVLVWSRTRHRASDLVDQLRADGIESAVAQSEEETVKNSDIVCTLTLTREAHVRGLWFQPGQHLNAVGAPPRPDHREIDSDGIARCRVVSDSWSLAMQESGDVLIPLAEGRIGKDHFRTELGMVITGQQPWRRSATETTLFNSVGMGIQDLATARLLVDRARAEGRGTEISFAS